MAKSAFPLLLAGGAALVLMSSSKKKTSAATKPAPERTPTRNIPARDGNPPNFEDLEDEDMDEEDGAPTPVPKPAPNPTPVPPAPTPTPEPDIPSSKPPIGPTAVGTCVNEIYTRDPVYMAGDIAETLSAKALTMFKESEYYFYLRPAFQTKLYDYMLARFTAMSNGSERHTAMSVVLREGLKHFNSGCAWEGPLDLAGEPHKLVWTGSRRLAIMAMETAGVEDISFNDLYKTSARYTIPRTAFGEPDPGFFTSETKPVPGTRVEILASDASRENAEHIIGEIVKLSGPSGELDQFEVRIIPTFQGVDVSPNLQTKHGFKVGSNAYFSQKGPTGIYRMFPKGMA